MPTTTTAVTTPQEALKTLEAFVAANPDMAKEEPEQFAKLNRMREALKKQPAGKPPSDELKKLVLELFRWQLDAQKADYQAQLDAVTQAMVKTPTPLLQKTKAALTEVVKMLDEAKAVGVAPSDASIANVDKALSRVQKAFAEVEAAASKTTEGITMKAVKRPIVSASGVALKPAMPPPRSTRK